MLWKTLRRLCHISTLRLRLVSVVRRIRLVSGCLYETIRAERADVACRNICFTRSYNRRYKKPSVDALLSEIFFFVCRYLVNIDRFATEIGDSGRKVACEVGE